MTKTYVIHSIESSTQERVFVVEGQRITGTIPVFVAELVDPSGGPTLTLTSATAPDIGAVGEAVTVTVSKGGEL